MRPITFRTRFAPSPTGLAHLGNARTALFSFLAARARGGEMLLRLEDTDRSRNTAAAAAALERDLRWLGLDWRETPPQSARAAAHEEKMAELAARGLAYPCFCTPEELARERQQCAAAGKPPRYSGKCAKLPESEAKARIAAGEKPAMRFRMPPEVVKVADAVRGELKFDGNDIGDFIIRRANGDFSFIFVNAVDDATDKVTCALRGEDHLPNTPRQLALLSALNLPPPQYGHLPLMTGADGKPLSKRAGASSLQELREMGYLPEALMNYLSRVGHTYDNTAFMTAEEMSRNFNISRISHSSARYDNAQLLNRQREALKKLNNNERRRWMSPALPPDIDAAAFSSAVINNVALLNDVREWSRALTNATPDASARKVITETGATFYTAAATTNKELPDANWKQFCAHLSKQTGLSGKNLYLPLRAALTGKTTGPEMAAFFTLLTPQERAKRLAGANN